MMDSDRNFYEVDGAVFRQVDGVMQVFNNDTGEFLPYSGDEDRVKRRSNPMTLEQVRPYMDVEPKLDSGKPEAAA